MCLALPGRVVKVVEGPAGLPTGIVSFGGVTKEVCLAYVPDARAGDYVLVHVGFALARIDEAEALASLGSGEPGDVTPKPGGGGDALRG